MKILSDWLKEFGDFNLTPTEVRSRLSLAGIAVEAIEETKAGPMLDIDLTINRADCLSHYGIAREVAALVRGRLRSLDSFPWANPRTVTEPVAGMTRVDIECPELCGRYTARLLRNVNVGPSPDWLRRRLEA